jgi:hypothetical protein
MDIDDMPHQLTHPNILHRLARTIVHCLLVRPLLAHSDIAILNLAIHFRPQNHVRKIELPTFVHR